MVRVPWNDMVTMKRVLDIGAQSLLVPYVSTAAEAKSAVSYTRYPPAGVRGVAGTTRATRFGRVKDYAKRAHEEICVLVQVETEAALDNIEAICAIDGIDGVFIGPADLHASMGHTGEIANPKVKPLIDQAIRRIRKCGQRPRHPHSQRSRRTPLARMRRALRRGGRRRGHPRARRRGARGKIQVMKPEIIITARGHAGTMATLQAEFSSHLLSEAPDRAEFLNSTPSRCAAWRHSAPCRSTAS